MINKFPHFLIIISILLSVVLSTGTADSQMSQYILTRKVGSKVKKEYESIGAALFSSLLRTCVKLLDKGNCSPVFNRSYSVDIFAETLKLLAIVQAGLPADSFNFCHDLFIALASKYARLSVIVGLAINLRNADKHLKTINELNVQLKEVRQTLGYSCAAP